MARYEYRCVRDGVFEVMLPIGTATARRRCAVCGEPADRIFSAPALNRTPTPLLRALDTAARSAEAPEIVTTLPGRRPRRTTVHPGHARLPRP
jgi:hypothetical protein